MEVPDVHYGVIWGAPINEQPDAGCDGVTFEIFRRMAHYDKHG